MIEFAFDMPVYTSVEGNPAIMICVNLIEGTLTRDVLVDVNNVIGAGTAVRKLVYYSKELWKIHYVVIHKRSNHNLHVSGNASFCTHSE